MFDGISAFCREFYLIFIQILSIFIDKIIKKI